jgi:predicted nucleic acid-binding Zn ribbon protein
MGADLARVVIVSGKKCQRNSMRGQWVVGSKKRRATILHTPMANTEADYLLELWDKRICPFCGKTMPEGERVGSGKKTEGGFCSLDCYADYYRREIIERAKKMQSLAERHRNS